MRTEKAVRVKVEESSLYNTIRKYCNGMARVRTTV
jgi:hypothetical protein